MTEAITISDIYAALNPLPALLSAKGKVKPVVELRLEANAGFHISMHWRKPYSKSEWDNEYQAFMGSDFSESLGKAIAFINELPSAKQAKLHHFMGKLGNLIDNARSDGIAVDYLNPLLDTMKRLSENVITYKKPKAQMVASEERG